MVSLLFISVLVGFLGSLTGLGGASILIPIMIFFGIPIKEAIASAMVCVIATSSGSGSSYVRDRLANVKIAMYLEIFTITGAILGATTTTIIPSVYLYFLFVLFLLTSFVRKHSINEDFVPSKKQEKLSKWLDLRGSYFDEAQKQIVEYNASNALLGGLGMFLAGLAAGMLGIGAGAFKVTVQENILKLPPKVSSTTSNFIIGMTGLAGVSVYLFSKLLNLTLMAPMAVGATIGAIVGGRVLNKFSNRTLRILFFVTVTFLIAQMSCKGVTSIWP